MARRLVLSGVAILVILIAINTVKGMEIGGVDPNGDGTCTVPQVYLIKKTFDICDQDIPGEWSGNQPLPGGQVPPSGIEGEGESQSGCVDFIGDRFNEYLFTGEQMAILVAARDSNGAQDISHANLNVNGIERVMCNEVDPSSVTGGTCVLRVGQTGDCTPGNNNKPFCDQYPVQCEWIPSTWFGHDVSVDLTTMPPAKCAGSENGFDPAFDKLYQCIFTAAPDDAGMSTVTVEVFDSQQNSGVSVPDNVFFNPAITLDIFAEDPSGGIEEEGIAFPAGEPGQTVYSMQTLKIKNTAEGGVDLFAWISATDLCAVPGLPAPMCPGNCIELDQWMEYRCKIGTIFNNPWNYIPNPNDKLDCTIRSCQAATPLMPDNMPLSIILNEHMAECWFRFTYPTPCIGDFGEGATGGEIIIYARAI